MSFSSLAETLPARHLGGENFFSDLSTDSRNLSSGSAFLALKGERFDGHDHVESAIKAGASGAIVAHSSDVDVPHQLWITRITH